MKYFTKTRNRRFALALGVGGLLSISFAAFDSTFGQFPTVAERSNNDGSTRPSASSILSRRTVNNRLFGTSTLGGATSPNPTRPSRFQSGAVRGPSGNFIGFDETLPFSRFNSYQQREFKSGVDYDVYALYRYYWQNKPPVVIGERPRPVSATPQEPFPYPTQTRSSALAQENVPIIPETPTSIKPTDESIRSSREVWMRQAPGSGGESSFQESPSPELGNFAPVAAVSEPNFDLDFANQIDRQPFPLTLPSLQNRQRSPLAEFQEYLELTLLRNPNVNPLSPIQVQFDSTSGTATVRGIVPTQESKVAAGQILLSDPRVQTVNNQLSTVPADNSQTPLPTFDPNVQ